MAAIFLSIKYHADGRNQAQIERLCGLLESAGHAPYCVVRDLENWGRVQFEPGELMRRTFAAIEASDLILVELSEKGVGLGIEAGYAHARGIPLAVAARAGSDISSTLQGIAMAACLYVREEEILGLAAAVLG